MRKLILQSHISLDGFIAGPNSEMDWIHLGAAPEYPLALADRCDTILMGRKMSRGFLDYWESVADNPPGGKVNPMAVRMVEMRKIVFSRTQSRINGRNVEVTNADLTATVNALKNTPGKDIIAYGGADFASQLISSKLVDEYHFFLNPEALGRGLPIFKGRTSLTLVKSIALPNGVIANQYLPR